MILSSSSSNHVKLFVTRDRLQAVSLIIIYIYIYTSKYLFCYRLYTILDQCGRGKSLLFPIKIARAPSQLLLRILLEQFRCIPPIHIIYTTSSIHRICLSISVSIDDIVFCFGDGSKMDSDSHRRRLKKKKQEELFLFVVYIAILHK